MGSVRVAAIVLLASALLIGLSLVAVLPPFEGFDETAHDSYIEQIAETGTWPRLNDPIAAEVFDYLQVGPTPRPLHDRWSYRAFFAASPATIARGRTAARAPRDPSRPWQPSPGHDNWEGQHPPLYYGLLAPVFNLSKGWSSANQLLLLRALSYLIGWLGLCIVSFSSGPASEGDAGGGMMALAPALWPALLPMWFPEMARLGNDCLVALLAGCAVALLRRSSSKDGLLYYSLLGIACALGLLTKALFVPLAAAILVWLACRTWRARRDRAKLRQRARGLAAFVVIIVVVAGWWYGKNLFDTGSLIGSNDEALLSGKGSLLALVLAHSHAITLRALILALVGTGISFLWTGTWSFIAPPAPAELPLALLVVVIAVGYVRAAVRVPPRGFEWIWPLTLALFLLGLLQHALVFIAAYGILAAPAWYLHAMAPVFAPMLGWGLAEASRWRTGKPFIAALLFYPVLFLPFAMGILALYYAGCGDKYPTRSSYDFSSATTCIAHVGGIIHNLSILSEPLLAIVLFGVGWALLLAGMILATRIWAAGAAPPSSSRPQPV